MLERFLNLNKIKTKRLSNHTSQYFINNRIENIYCYRPQKSWHGGNRAEKARHFEKIQLGEHLATKLIDIGSVTWLAIKGMP